MEKELQNCLPFHSDLPAWKAFLLKGTIWVMDPSRSTTTWAEVLQSLEQNHWTDEPFSSLPAVSWSDENGPRRKKGSLNGTPTSS